jgi:hypothetical protein
MQTKPCPDCGKFMIRIATGHVLNGQPLVYPLWWRCACGRTEAGVGRDVVDLDRFQRLWNMANRTELSSRGG